MSKRSLLAARGEWKIAPASFNVMNNRGCERAPGQARGSWRRRSRPIATREAFVSTDIGWLQEQHRRPGLQAIAKITCIREGAGKTSTVTADYLFSSHASVERANDVGRTHWGVEKPLALVPRRGHG
ncbi:MAG: hypothetical protein WA624_16025 [Methylocella sp.]